MPLSSRKHISLAEYAMVEILYTNLKLKWNIFIGLSNMEDKQFSRKMNPIVLATHL